VRLAIAFLVAPISTTVTIWPLFSTLWMLHLGIFAHQPYNLALLNAIQYSRPATVVAAAVTLVGAAPAYWLFTSLGWLRLGQFATLGVVLGWTPFAVAAVALRISADFWLPLSLLGAACGLVSATVFWLIGVAPSSPARRLDHGDRGAA
jgi:hypothetical protein